MALSTIITQLLGGLVVTIEIFFLTLILSLPLGLLVAFGRMSKWAPFKRLGKKAAKEGSAKAAGILNAIANFKPIQFIVKIYISVLRGTPLMLQLMVVYFGPYFIFGIKITNSYRFVATIIGFVLNYAAYFAEIYRSGIESMEVGQYEAATVLGYTRSQTFFKIILLQVVKRILPSVTNEVITLVKDTSLAYTIGVTEMFTVSKIISAGQRSMVAFIAAAIFYYIFNVIVAFVMERFERRINYFR